MAFGGLIGKETQVDLSQYVTETELNSKGFATQSWVNEQINNSATGTWEFVTEGVTQDYKSGAQTLDLTNDPYLLIPWEQNQSAYLTLPPTIAFKPSATSKNPISIYFGQNQEFQIQLRCNANYNVGIYSYRSSYYYELHYQLYRLR